VIASLTGMVSTICSTDLLRNAMCLVGSGPLSKLSLV
jgi:hypothetical protein